MPEEAAEEAVIRSAERPDAVRNLIARERQSKREAEDEAKTLRVQLEQARRELQHRRTQRPRRSPNGPGAR